MLSTLEITLQFDLGVSRYKCSLLHISSRAGTVSALSMVAVMQPTSVNDEVCTQAKKKKKNETVNNNAQHLLGPAKAAPFFLCCSAAQPLFSLKK